MAEPRFADIFKPITELGTILAEAAKEKRRAEKEAFELGEAKEKVARTKAFQTKFDEIAKKLRPLSTPAEIKTEFKREEFDIKPGSEEEKSFISQVQDLQKQQRGRTQREISDLSTTFLQILYLAYKRFFFL